MVSPIANSWRVRRGIATCLISSMLAVAGCGSDEPKTPPAAGAPQTPETPVVPPTGPTPTHTLSGSVTGLAGSGLVLQNNGGDDLAVHADGSFTFAAPVAEGSGYAVTVKRQPVAPAQTCTVNAGSGTMPRAPVNSVSVICSVNAYRVSGTVSGMTGSGMVLQNNAGDDVVVNANGAFTFPTAVAAGAAYTVTVRSRPRAPQETCTVTGGSGTVVDANIGNVQIACVPVSRRVIFIADETGNSVGAYSFTYLPVTSLAPLGPLSAAPAPRYLVMRPDNRFLYTASASGTTISGFAVDMATGIQAEIPGSPYAKPPGAGWMAMDPLGRFLYATNPAANSVSVYRINGVTGALTPVSGSPFAAGSLPFGVSTAPAGRFLYVANEGSNDVSIYAVDQATGALSPVAGSPVTAGTSSRFVVFAPDGKHAYVTNSGSASISMYAVLPATGAMTPMGTIATGSSPQQAAVDPWGQNLYVPNEADSTVSIFRIDAATGALSLVAHRITGVTNGRHVILDPSLNYTYMIENGATTLNFALRLPPDGNFGGGTAHIYTPQSTAMMAVATE